MDDFAIKIEGIGKRYSVGKQKDGSLRGTLSSVLKSTVKVDVFWALKDVSFNVRRRSNWYYWKKWCRKIYVVENLVSNNQTYYR